MADGLDVKFEVDGDKQIAQMLTGLGLDMKDLHGAMKDVGSGAKRYFSGQVFASRGRIIGEPWPRLSTATAAQKARRYPGRPPLVRTGVMQRSFTYRSTPMTVTIGNSAPHFKYHQSSAPRRRLPRRVMLKLTNQLIDDSTKIIATSLAAKVKARAGK